MRIPVSGPKAISKTHFLSKTSADEAKNFSPDGKRGLIKIDTFKQAAIVAEFDLNTKQKQKLGRSTNLVEAVVSGISDRTSVHKLSDQLTKLGVKSGTISKSQFFFVTVRRRIPESPKHSLTISRQHRVADTQSFVVGVTAEKSRVKPTTTVLFNGKKGAITVSDGKISQALAEDDSTNNTNDTVTSYPNDPNQDFAKCYSECLGNVPEWLLGIVSGICGFCVAVIGVAAASATGGGISIPVLIGVCGACVAAVAVVMGNCFLTCHEMAGN